MRLQGQRDSVKHRLCGQAERYTRNRGPRNTRPLLSLTGLNDPHVGKALRLLHANPGRDWTVDDLAREVAISRSVLAQRFTELVGEAPMRYLAGWRMQLAKQMMRDGARNIQEVATRVATTPKRPSTAPSSVRRAHHRQPGARARSCSDSRGDSVRKEPGASACSLAADPNWPGYPCSQTSSSSTRSRSTRRNRSDVPRRTVRMERRVAARCVGSYHRLSNRPTRRPCAACPAGPLTTRSEGYRDARRSGS